ncbi:hypothetical protein BEE62_08645 [Marinobacter nauticus]|uniref:Uncharacterized protein n=1 Tax=Marinobacter nauticus TaxID=2743 RepID=A0A1M2UXV6_MARNT|nr:hypothetical protein BEE62_08645 [Marinobacter nauticus]
MPIMFAETGCDFCRKYWTHPFLENRDEIIKLLADPNWERQARLYQCNKCGAYWDNPNGAYPEGLTKEEVEQFYGIKNS